MTDYLRQDSWLDSKRVGAAERTICNFFCKAQGLDPDDYDRDGPLWTLFRTEAQTLLRELRENGLDVVPL